MKIMFQLTTYQNESLNSLNAKEFICAELTHNRVFLPPTRTPTTVTLLTVGSRVLHAFWLKGGQCPHWLRQGGAS